MKETRQNLNAACQYLGDVVAKLRSDDEYSVEAVKRAFATLEDAIARVNSDLDQLQADAGPTATPPDHVRQ
jgi:hypothetical protein